MEEDFYPDLWLVRREDHGGLYWTGHRADDWQQEWTGDDDDERPEWSASLTDADLMPEAEAKQIAERFRAEGIPALADHYA